MINHQNIVSKRYSRTTGMIVCLLCVLLCLGLSVGSTGFEMLSSMFADAASSQIIWMVRLPRSVGALLAGALLGMTGAIAQGLFRNPLADPYLLGSASGASFFVALSLVFFGGSPFASLFLLRVGLTGMAFMGAVIAVLLTLLLAGGVQNSLRLLLSGVIVAVIFGALSSLVALSSPDILPAMQSFLLGSTSFVSWNACIVMAVVLLVGLFVALALSRVLDALTLGETTAQSLGLKLKSTRISLIAVMSLTTGAAVAQVGLIAFVGLVAPHLVRSLVRTNHAERIFLSGLIGAGLLLTADILARVIIAPQELPVGVLTAILGGGYLFLLMYRGRKEGAFK
jgi:iron complex transport system permease protein